MFRTLHALLIVLLLGSTVAQAAPLRIAVSRTPLSLPLYVAAAEGYFEQAGLTVELVDCVSGQRCMKAMLQGEAQVATVSESVAMFQSFERDDFAILGTFATSGTDIKLIGRKDAGITRPADLAGKRIGFIRGTASQFFLDAYLLLHGVDPRTVELVALPTDDIVSALRSRQVVAVTAWEPFGYAIVRELGANASVLPPSGVYHLTFNLVALRKTALDRDADLERLFVALQRAETLIQDDPARAKAILRQRMNVDERFVEWTWQGVEYRLGLEQGLVKTLEAEARWALREGYVKGGGVPNYLRFIHAAPLSRTSATAIGLAK